MNDEKKQQLLKAAQSVFLRHGYKRVTMGDVAEAAGISRAALYLNFKNKEEVFIGVLLQWVDETMATVEREMTKAKTPVKKLEQAFEIWAVRSFEAMLDSPGASVLVECNLDFAEPTLRQGYKKFEQKIAAIIQSSSGAQPAKTRVSPDRAAHILTSAVRGFRHVASTPAELRQMIKDLLTLSLQ